MTNLSPNLEPNDKPGLVTWNDAVGVTNGKIYQLWLRTGKRFQTSPDDKLTMFSTLDFSVLFKREQELHENWWELMRVERMLPRVEKPFINLHQSLNQDKVCVSLRSTVNESCRSHQIPTFSDRSFSPIVSHSKHTRVKIPQLVNKMCSHCLWANSQQIVPTNLISYIQYPRK